MACVCCLPCTSTQYKEYYSTGALYKVSSDRTTTTNLSSSGDFAQASQAPATYLPSREFAGAALLEFLQTPNARFELLSQPLSICTLHCLLVHHTIDSLMNVMLTFPGHALAKLALLHDTELIKELKLLVSTEPTPSVMSTPTGIPPPHIELAKTMQQLEMMTDLMTVFRTLMQSDDLIGQAKHQAIVEKAWDSGHHWLSSKRVSYFSSSNRFK